MNPRDQRQRRHREWANGLTTALRTTTPLARIAPDSLRHAAAHFNRSLDPDAWIYATLCAAELHRRQARHDREQPRPTGLTAAELAWKEQQQQRDAA